MPTCHRLYTHLRNLIANVRFSLGTGTRGYLDREDQDDLLLHYHTCYPDSLVIGRHEDSELDNPNHLFNLGIIHRNLVLDGRRITPSHSLTHAHNSIVQADFDGIRYVGQLFKIFSHDQPGVHNRSHLASVRWFKRTDAVDTSPWDA